jgi:hypothetical protein
MSDERHHDHELSRGDAELVRRIAESYRPPEPAASARAAFRARLDARIRRRAVGRRWVAGATTAAVAVAVAIVWLRGPFSSDAPAPDATSDEALLALALPADSEEEALPADYQAIEDLLLEGEGV